MNITYGLRRALQLNPGGPGDEHSATGTGAGAEVGERVPRLAAGLCALRALAPGGRVAILALNSDRLS